MIGRRLIGHACAVGAVSAAGLRETFDALAPSKQKADVMNVTGAKTPETRRRRIAAVVEKLS